MTHEVPNLSYAACYQFLRKTHGNIPAIITLVSKSARERTSENDLFNSLFKSSLQKITFIIFNSGDVNFDESFFSTQFPLPKETCVNIFSNGGPHDHPPNYGVLIYKKSG